MILGVSEGEGAVGSVILGVSEGECAVGNVSR